MREKAKGNVIDVDTLQPLLSGVLKSNNNLSELSDKQISLNTLTQVSAALNEQVLTKDPITGNAIWLNPQGSSLQEIEFFNQYITEDITIVQFNNGLSVGPVEVNLGITVTIESGSVWVIL